MLETLFNMYTAHYIDDVVKAGAQARTQAEYWKRPLVSIIAYCLVEQENQPKLHDLITCVSTCQLNFVLKRTVLLLFYYHRVDL